MLLTKTQEDLSHYQALPINDNLTVFLTVDMRLMTLSECWEKQEVRFYAPFNRHWESVGVNVAGSIPVVHPINTINKSMTYDYFRCKYGEMIGIW